MKSGIGRGRKGMAAVLAALTGWMIFSPTSAALRSLPERLRLALGQFVPRLGQLVLSGLQVLGLRFILREHV